MGYMMTQEANEKVRSQYENFPYPHRNPEDEKHRLISTTCDGLGKINHGCFRGRRDLRQGGRVLVAGGGTGDAAIYLAEQLRGSDARVVYLDISDPSMAVARQRAEVRGLDNIDWIMGSLLDLPEMNLEPFDYINCSGVLHHLEDPAQGLAALKSVLHEQGAMAIMVYGQYGRTGVYQVQDLMRLINQGEENMQTCIENTRVIVNGLPPTNWFMHSENQFQAWKGGDDEVFDLFLHSRDRAYTVPQLYDWVEGCGLYLVEFCENRLFYCPEFTIGSQAVREKVHQLPLRDRQAIAELIHGSLTKHTFFVSCEADMLARPNDVEQIPFWADGMAHNQILEAMQNQPEGGNLTLEIQGTRFQIRESPFTRAFLTGMDGETAIGSLVEQARAKTKGWHSPAPTTNTLLEDFGKLFDTLHLFDCLFLRHQSIPPFPRLDELQR